LLAGLLVIALLAATAVIKWGIDTSVPGGPGETAATNRNCVAVNLVSSDEKAPTLTQLARRYRDSGRGVDGRCVDMRVSVGSSRLTADHLARGAAAPWDTSRDGPRPDVWSPSSSVWTQRLRSQTQGRSGQVGLDSTLPSVTRTPVVIAMPRPMAQALGWPTAKLGWRDLVALAKDPKGWGAKGHPEWGRFTLGKTNPNTSTTGLEAMTSTVTALLGGEPLTAPALRAPAVVADARALEAAAVHYGSSVSVFLQNLYTADRDGQGLSYVSAIALEETVVVEYNNGDVLGLTGRQPKPHTPLVAIYPADGTLASDSPYAILQAPWVGADKRRAAEAFLRYLREPAQKRAFLDAGFRDEADRAGPPISRDPGLRAEPKYRTLPAPDAATAQAVLDLWNAVRKPATVLMVLDVSGSMTTLVPPTGKTRLRLAQDAARPAADSLARADQLGLWSFSSPVSGSPNPWRVAVAPGPVAEVAGRYRAGLDGLRAGGNTALYATTRAAVQALKQPADNRINAVVVLTDGENKYAPDNDLNRLLADLSPANNDNPVRVFTIAYGNEADAGTLNRIARAARGAAYDARDATTIQQVITDVLSNF
jgi:Ca-activated chloride channel family protein